MKNLLASVLLLFAFSAQAAQPAPRPIEECAIHLPFGTPKVRPHDVTPICREGYFTIHDNRAKIPIVSAYIMMPHNAAAACAARDSSFEADVSLRKEARALPKDYAKSGYDIGHMVSAEDLKYSALVQGSAALLSNAAPQLPGFNRGIWKKLEDTTRGWAITRERPLLVYVGPIYARTKDKTIGDSRVTVPNGFYKIIIDTVTRETLVFMFKHEASQAELLTFNTSLAELQRKTGVRFPMPARPVWIAMWDVTMKSNLKAKAEACSLGK